MSQPSSNYLHRVEQWIRGGADLQRINFSTVQRFRARIVYEAYWEWLQDHFIDPSDTLRRLAKREYAMLLHKAKEGNSEAQEYVDALNIREGVPRTPSEISSDVYTLNYIVNTLTVSTRAMDRIKVTASADWLMSHGMKTGNDRSVTSGAKIYMDIYQNFNEKDNPQESMANPNLNVTGDVSIIDNSRSNLSEKERKSLERHYGLTPTEVKELKEQEDGTFAADDDDDVEENKQEMEMPMPDEENDDENIGDNDDGTEA